MSTQLKSLTLKCPSCGAALDITLDMERFACGYCGTEQVVQRQGGTVALTLVTEAISRVQVGTDRTAAELALRRINDEMAALDAEVQQIRLVGGNQIGPGTSIALGFVLLLAFQFGRKAEFEGAPVFLFFAAIAFAGPFFPDPHKKRLEEIKMQHAILTEKRAQQKAIVDT